MASNPNQKNTQKQKTGIKTKNKHTIEFTNNTPTIPTKPTKTVETTVKLGINDGNQIVVTSGLKEGDSILQFVPGQDVDKTGKPNSCDPDGTCYDSAGKEIK